MVTQGFSQLPVYDVYGQGGESPVCVVIWGCNISGSRGHDSSDGMCGGMHPYILIGGGVVCAQYGWWFPEESPPDYGWKKSSLNLLFGKMEYDPDTGSESLKSALCQVYKAD